MGHLYRVQAILDQANLTGLEGRVREGQNLPISFFGPMGYLSGPQDQDQDPKMKAINGGPLTAQTKRQKRALTILAKTLFQFQIPFQFFFFCHYGLSCESQVFSIAAISRRHRHYSLPPTPRSCLCVTNVTCFVLFVSHSTAAQISVIFLDASNEPGGLCHKYL